MNTVQLAVTTQIAAARFARRLRSRVAQDRNERGEGVISTAIAVLIMAVIGAAMFAAYLAIFKSSSKDVSEKISSITIPAGATGTTA
jgi:hypothetical protein